VEDESMKRILAAGAVLVGLTLLGGEAAAQTGTARGKVVDDKGQVIEGATLLIEFQGGVTRKNETKTNKKGEYTQVGLQPGNYKITVSKDGFAPATMENVRIGLGEPTYLPDIKLAPPRAAGGGGAPGDPAAEKAMAELRASVEQAIALTKEGKLDEAEALYKDLAAKNPTRYQLYYNLGIVQAQKKDAASAEASYLKALEVKPDYAEAQNALNTLYLSTGQAAKANELAAKAASANPNDAKAQFQVGYVAFNSGKYDEADAAFKKAEAIDPNYAETYYFLGTIALSQNKLEDCVARFEKYLALAPTGQNAATAQQLLAACKPKK
jgi:tetratricopeptide (TPR) repeat protein